MVNEKMVDYRIEPYFHESSIQIMIDLLCVGLAAIVMIIARFPLSYFIFVAGGYSILALFLHYRVSIQALIDKRKKDYVTEVLSIKSYSNEFSFVENGKRESYIHNFYAKDKDVDKRKIKVIDVNKKNKKLRSVMSTGRWLKFSVFNEQQINHLQVTYLKRSKILIQVDLVEELDKKIKTKNKKEIEKALHHINFSV